MLTLDYIAGLFDGEGCLNLSASGKSYNVSVTITNTSLPVLLKLKDQLGGSVSTLPRYREHWRPAYVWELSSTPAEGLVRQLLPLLQIKREEAEAWLAFKELRRQLTAARLRRPRPGRQPATYTDGEIQQIEGARARLLAFRTPHVIRN